MHKWTGRRWLVAVSLAAAFAAAGSVAIGRDPARTAEKRIEAEMAAKIDRAQQAYDAARKRCGNAVGDAAKACTAKARADRDAAVRIAKIGKVRKLNELKERDEERREGKLKPTSPEAKYAAAKARCEMMGFERDHCLADAKQRFHKS